MLHWFKKLAARKKNKKKKVDQEVKQPKAESKNIMEEIKTAQVTNTPDNIDDILEKLREKYKG